MAAFYGDSRIVVPFTPTLSHMSLAKLAVRLCNEIGFKTLKKVHSEMESGYLENFEELSQENCTIFSSRVRKTLLLVPTNLRSKVLGAVDRIEREIYQWRSHHRTIARFDNEEFTFFWRSDGTIDRIKTAQEICRNKNVDIKNRFVIACKYFLANEVKTLWAELKANSDISDMAPRAKGVIRFWVQWMRGGAQISWTRAAHKCLNPRWFSVSNGSTLSSLFRLLKPEDRRKFFPCLVDCQADDLWLCLYAVTEDEQVEIMKLWPIEVLKLHMHWPLARDFLKTADKAWDFLLGYTFCIVLKELLNRKNRTDYDFEYLAEEFWLRSPTHFKEYAEECGCKVITKFIEERTAKRKAENYDEISLKRFRKNL